MVRDFQHFVDHGTYLDEENDPTAAFQFALEGERWKHLRASLTPAFTNGRLKAMFTTVLDCKEPLLRQLEKTIHTNQVVEIHPLIEKFTTNLIASVVFGVEIDSFNDPNNTFCKMANSFHSTSWKNGFRMFCFNLWPNLLKWSGLRLLDREARESLLDFVKQSIDLRENGNVVRKDFFQLLIQLRNTGAIQLDDEWQTVIRNESTKTLTIEQVAAQTFGFYLAGFGTTASTISFCLFEIAKNPDIQQKVYEEIDNVFAGKDEQFTFDSLKKLEYLDACVDETLRKHIIIPTFSRKCTKEYTIPDTNITIVKGTHILIPAFSIQRDDKYYPNPEQFDPSRFFTENKWNKTKLDMPYLSFGDGPRGCTGSRMAKLVIKVGIVSILQKYRIELHTQYEGNEIKYEPVVNILVPLEGFKLKFTARV
ncbi:probable cytochrome P450 6d4 isoform X2 [Bradysia coprophila]|nr:probable cytochrome P450 6d4 isoform X2 [Bradysia coprophila]